MSQKKANKRKRGNRERGFPPSAETPAASKITMGPASGKRPVRWGLIVLFLSITFGGTYLAIWLRPKDSAPRYTYKVLQTYQHDPQAFTQGLVYDDGFLWESTGRYGESTMRKIDLESGEILNQYALEDKFFGEGMTVVNDKLYQITWKEGTAFVYDRDFNVLKTFRYTGEGWGLTTDGSSLIFSDGSREIQFLDPDTFEERRSIWVRQPSGAHVGQLNELEYYQGKIYANRYQSDLIYEIDPESGDVTAIIDLKGLWTDRPVDGVLNGIAVNPKSRKLLVTGKLCPFIYELDLIPEP